MTEDLYKFIDHNPSHDNLTKIKSYADRIHTSNEAQNYPELVELMEHPPQNLPEPFRDALPSIHEQVIFHIKKK